MYSINIFFLLDLIKGLMKTEDHTNNIKGSKKNDAIYSISFKNALVFILLYFTIHRLVLIFMYFWWPEKQRFEHLYHIKATCWLECVYLSHSSSNSILNTLKC